MGNRWVIEDLKDEMKRYNSPSEFREKNYSAYKAATRRGLYMVERKRKSKWTIEEVKQEMMNHKSLSDFRKNSMSAYRAGIRLGLTWSAVQ